MSRFSGDTEASQPAAPRDGDARSHRNPQFPLKNPLTRTIKITDCISPTSWAVEHAHTYTQSHQCRLLLCCARTSPDGSHT